MVSVFQLLPKPPDPDPDLLPPAPTCPPILATLQLTSASLLVISLLNPPPPLVASSPLDLVSPPLLADPLRRLPLPRLSSLILNRHSLSSELAPPSQKSASPSALSDWSCRLAALPPSPSISPNPMEALPLQFVLTKAPSISLSATVVVALWKVPSSSPTGSIYTIPWLLLVLTGFSLLGFISIRPQIQLVQLPLYEVTKLVLGFILPLYEDNCTALCRLFTALCSSTFGLFRSLSILLWQLDGILLDFSFFPVYRVLLDLCCPLASSTEVTFLLVGVRSVLSKITEISVSKVIKGSVAAKLGIVNCALAAVSISDLSPLHVLSKSHGFISFTKLFVVEIGGLFRDFKCLNVLIALIICCHFLYFIVFSVCLAILAMVFCTHNICSVYGE